MKWSIWDPAPIAEKRRQGADKRKEDKAIRFMNTRTVSLLLAAYTLICGLEDLRHRKIRTDRSFLFAAIGLIFSLILRRDPAEILFALVPGLVFLILSGVSRGGIGIGDAVYLMVCAAYTNVERLLWMIVFSLFLSAVGALCMIVKGALQCRNIKNRSLPYLTFMIPALFGSFVIYRAA